MKIIGIDPGLSGAIAILENNKVLNIFDMPVMAEGKKNKRQLNSAQLVKLLRENISKDEETAVVVEQVNAMRDKVLQACLILVKLLVLLKVSVPLWSCQFFCASF